MFIVLHEHTSVIVHTMDNVAKILKPGARVGQHYSCQYCALKVVQIL